MKGKTLFSFLILTILKTTAATAPTVSPNKKYSFAGTFSINTASTYGSQETQWSANYSIPFTNSFLNSSIIALLSYSQLDIDFSNKTINIKMQVGSIRQTDIIASFYSSMVNHIRILKVRLFLSFDSYATGPRFVSYSAHSSPMRNITNQSSYGFSFSNLVPLQMGHNATTFAFFTGLSLTAADSQLLLDLFLKVNQTNSTSVLVILGSRSAKPTYVDTVTFSWLSFGTSQVNNPSFGLFSVNTHEINSPSSNITDSKMHDWNVMGGISGFAVHNSTYFDFGLNFSSSGLLSFKTISQLSYITIVSMTVQTFYCPYSSPYLLSTDNNCHSNCPVRYQNDNKQLICSACPYDCYTCLGLTCSSCSSLIDHRKINYQMRCVPIDGYFDDGINSQAQKCKVGCKTCQNLSYCLTCENNYYLDSSSMCQYSSTSSQNNIPIPTSPPTNPTVPNYPTNSDPSTQSTAHTKEKSSGNTVKIAVIASSCIFITVIIIIIVIKIVRSRQRQIDRQVIFRRESHQPEKKVDQRGSQLIFRIQDQGSKAKLERVKPEIDDLHPAAIRVRPARRHRGPSLWKQMPEEWYYPQDQICAIDLEEKPLVRLACGHYFHLACITSWLTRKRKCPMDQGIVQQDAFLHCSGCTYRYRDVKLSQNKTLKSMLKKECETRCEDCRQ